MKEALLRVENVSIGYTHDIVRQVSFDVAEKSILAIVGESGSGKSTLLKSLIGPYPGAGSVRCGKILYRGEDLVTMPHSLPFVDGKSLWCSSHPVRRLILCERSEHSS